MTTENPLKDFKNSVEVTKHTKGMRTWRVKIRGDDPEEMQKRFEGWEAYLITKYGTVEEEEEFMRKNKK